MTESANLEIMTSAAAGSIDWILLFFIIGTPAEIDWCSLDPKNVLEVAGVSGVNDDK